MREKGAKYRAQQDVIVIRTRSYEITGFLCILMPQAIMSIMFVARNESVHLRASQVFFVNNTKTLAPALDL